MSTLQEEDNPNIPSEKHQSFVESIIDNRLTNNWLFMSFASAFFFTFDNEAIAHVSSKVGPATLLYFAPG